MRKAESLTFLAVCPEDLPAAEEMSDGFTHLIDESATPWLQPPFDIFFGPLWIVYFGREVADNANDDAMQMCAHGVVMMVWVRGCCKC